MEFYFCSAVWVRSFTDSDLPDTDNIEMFENTTLINQNKKGKGRAEQIDQINRSGIFEEYNVVSVRQIWVRKQTHHILITKNKIPYSRDLPEVPMN